MTSASGSPAPPSRTRIASILIATELGLCVLAVIALSAWSMSMLSGRLGAHRELEHFADARLAARMSTSAPDQSLWSPKRVLAWQASLKREATPLGVFRIRRLG